MFGMLDYRAHKLYLILMFIPHTLIFLVGVFGLPLINYGIGVSLADERIYQIIISLISVFIVEVIWILLVQQVFEKVLSFIFELFVDVIPDDGRTKEEAMWGVWGGKKAISAMEFGQHPKEWSQEVMEYIPNSDWVQKLFYKEVVEERIGIMKVHYTTNPETPYTDFEVNKVLEDFNLKKGIIETYLCDKLLRRGLYNYAFFLFLLIVHPAG